MIQPFVINKRTTVLHFNFFFQDDTRQYCKPDKIKVWGKYNYFQICN